MIIVLNLGLEAVDNGGYIGYDNVFKKGGTVTASSEATGYAKENAIDYLPFTRWKPTAASSEWIKVDHGTAYACDYLAVYGHTLAASVATIKAQYSTDNASWSDAHTEVMPATTEPLMVIFNRQTARYWRVLVNGTSAAELGVVYVGQILQQEVGFQPGFTPAGLGRDDEVLVNSSRSGQFIGQSVLRRGESTQMAFNEMSQSYARDEYDPFLDHAATKPFFLAWNQDDFPSEVGFCWVDGALEPLRYSRPGFMSHQMRIRMRST